MSKIIILSDGNSIQAKNQERGKLFEKLMSEVLSYYGYEIDDIPSINYAGMEIDIVGKDKVYKNPLYAECKFCENEIDTPKLQAFYGKYRSRLDKNNQAEGL